MVVHSRAEGAVVNVLKVKLVPSHSHVAALLAGNTLPPNMTETWRLAAKASAEPTSPGGEVDGVRCTQLTPSNSQVSERLTNALLPPPHKTVWLRVESNDMAANWRAGGTWLVLTGPQFSVVGLAWATTAAPVTPKIATPARTESFWNQGLAMSRRP